ncbi:pentatricopeptide repeat-containing protein At1g07740, mitochondrial isoform X1 [Punica granatum]|uniref:Pentatricopeptide repeat-containing protein At1g07740, mitochondrial isoform X1 n=3 Tax=Punica granatum TaxID=22663 RepID=A0A6P8EJM1_PUNGR|nr:pentatricopeptide repeat-containing protein At1g07740, mitochondrial isoform X1 [Punica granatum]XP_031405879.1 pentatricopeptide repeat-containing protein At1g07740, mitochondrial isoform X1 [Punica granatum]
MNGWSRTYRECCRRTLIKGGTTYCATRTQQYHQQLHHRRQNLREPIPFITSLKQVRDPEEALALFHEYRKMGFKHYYPSYSALIYKLARSREFKEIEEILSYIRAKDLYCKESVFIGLIQHYGKAQLVEKATELFHKMGSFNCVRTLQSLNAILNVLVDNDRLLDAVALLGSSKKMGFRLNSVSYNIIIKGWLRKGEWEAACEVLDQMLERKIYPSVVTYNSLLGFLCRNRRVDEATSLFEDMKVKGTRLNAVTYALLMEGLCLIGKYKEAKNLMFDMEYRGCKPNLANFGVLMSDLGKRGEIEEAKNLLKEMKRRRFKPDVVTYNILINYMCKEGRVSEAYKVFVEMQVAGREPNAATYRMMVDGFCKVDDFEEGLKVLSSMVRSRHSPRSETFGCLVLGLIRMGNVDGACFVIEEMVKRKVKVDLEAWEALVRFACGADRCAADLLIEVSTSFEG